MNRLVFVALLLLASGAYAQYDAPPVPALGVPYPSQEQFRTTLGAVLGNTQYVSVSAGATTFPPLSPLVTPPSLQR